MVIPVINREQNLALPDKLIIINAQIRHVTGHVRRDTDFAPLCIGVVRLDMVPSKKPVEKPDHGNKNNARDQELFRQRADAFLFFVLPLVRLVILVVLRRLPVLLAVIRHSIYRVPAAPRRRVSFDWQNVIPKQIFRQ